MSILILFLLFDDYYNIGINKFDSDQSIENDTRRLDLELSLDDLAGTLQDKFLFLSRKPC